MTKYTSTINRAVAESAIGTYFKLDGSHASQPHPNTRFSTEVFAGLSTFFAMAYIIAVNASIVSDTGGTCVCRAINDPLCKTDEAYAACVQIVRRDLVTATAAITALSSFVMGLAARLPVCLAPGMSLNAYFTYQVVGYHGSGPFSYQMALTGVFVEGMLFMALTLCGFRQWIGRIFPRSLRMASSAGIGLFLTLIGLGPAGLNIVNGNIESPLMIGGCLAEYRDSFGRCTEMVMRSPTMWLGICLGGMITALLLLYRVKGAIILGIILVSVASWPRGTAITIFPYTPSGDEAFLFFKRVVTFHPIEKVLAVQQWELSGSGGQLALVIITMLYVDLLDTTGALYALATFLNIVDERTGDFEGSSIAFMIDGAFASIGSLFGVPPVTSYIESSVGIIEGGRTGLTAMAAGLCFFVSVFFAPIFASIPPWATGSTLVIIGVSMFSAVSQINWKYPGDAIPAFLTLAVMPFAYSVSKECIQLLIAKIAYGLIAGLCSYILLNTSAFILKLLLHIVPPEYDQREAWDWKLQGGFLPTWLVVLFCIKY